MKVRRPEFMDIPEKSLTGKLDGSHGSRKKSVLKSHLGDSTIAGQRLLDLSGFVRIHYQRLIAVNMLVVRNGGKQHIFVEMVRCADVDNINLRIFSDLPVIDHRYLRLNLSTSILGGFHPGGSDMGYAGMKVCMGIVKRNGLVSIGVHLADKSETKNADIVCFHYT